MSRGRETVHTLFATLRFWSGGMREAIESAAPGRACSKFSGGFGPNYNFQGVRALRQADPLAPPKRFPFCDHFSALIFDGLGPRNGLQNVVKI